MRNPFKTVLHFVGGQGHFENLITAISPLWQQFPSFHVGRPWGTDLLGVRGWSGAIWWTNEIKLPKLLLAANNDPFTRKTFQNVFQTISRSSKTIKESCSKGSQQPEEVPATLKAKSSPFQGPLPHFNGSCTVFQGRRGQLLSTFSRQQTKW